MKPTAFRKTWLLCSLDGHQELLEIQRNDALMLVENDDDALRRARYEARRGRRHAMEAVALHRDKGLNPIATMLPGRAP